MQQQTQRRTLQSARKRFQCRNFWDPGLGFPMRAIYGSNLRSVCSDNFRAHIKEKQINTKAITDLKECKCRRRAELEMTTGKEMSLQAVLHQLSNTLLDLALAGEQGRVLSVSSDDTNRRQLKYQIFRYHNPFICYYMYIRILEVSSPVPL